jgi:hypothetical protein
MAAEIAEAAKAAGNAAFKAGEFDEAVRAAAATRPRRRTRCPRVLRVHPTAATLLADRQIYRGNRGGPDQPRALLEPQRRARGQGLLQGGAPRRQQVHRAQSRVRGPPALAGPRGRLAPALPEECARPSLADAAGPRATRGAVRRTSASKTGRRRRRPTRRASRSTRRRRCLPATLANRSARAARPHAPPIAHERPMRMRRWSSSNAAPPGCAACHAGDEGHTLVDHLPRPPMYGR